MKNVLHYIVKVIEVSDNKAAHTLAGVIRDVPQYVQKEILSVNLSDNPLTPVVNALNANSVKQTCGYCPRNAIAVQAGFSVCQAHYETYTKRVVKYK